MVAAEALETKDKAGLLDAILAVACKPTEYNCTAEWTTAERRRRVRRSLAMTSLEYTVRIELDQSAPVAPEASPTTKLASAATPQQSPQSVLGALDTY